MILRWTIQKDTRKTSLLILSQHHTWYFPRKRLQVYCNVVLWGPHKQHPLQQAETFGLGVHTHKHISHLHAEKNSSAGFSNGRMHWEEWHQYPLLDRKPFPDICIMGAYSIPQAWLVTPEQTSLIIRDKVSVEVVKAVMSFWDCGLVWHISAMFFFGFVRIETKFFHKHEDERDFTSFPPSFLPLQCTAAYIQWECPDFNEWQSITTPIQSTCCSMASYSIVLM